MESGCIWQIFVEEDHLFIRNPDLLLNQFLDFWMKIEVKNEE